MDLLITMAQLPALRRELHVSGVAEPSPEGNPPVDGRPVSVQAKDMPPVRFIKSKLKAMVKDEPSIGTT
jgi:hypothetical protein